MRRIFALLAFAAAVFSGPAAAQLAGLPGAALPPLGLPGEILANTLDETLDETGKLVERSSEDLLRLRGERIDTLIRQNRKSIERDARGEPARKGELLLLDPDEAALEAARAAGFRVLGREDMPSLSMSVVKLAVPRGMNLAEAEAELTRVAPGAGIAPDSLHFPSGSALFPAAAASAVAKGATIRTKVGIIDGAPGKGLAASRVKGFARGAPKASDHGSAIVSLLAGAGASDLFLADVYGSDPAGGNALAIASGLDWLIGKGARVVSISLTGPDNAVVGKAIAAAQRKGVVVVAAVGNDGPAAPPAYPASYSGVLAVTAVDGKARPLIEAGRAAHLDYAAPGADIRGKGKSGKWIALRGTSFAVPLVAARAAAALDGGGSWRPKLDKEAEDLGPKGPDSSFGRGLLCRACGKN